MSRVYRDPTNSFLQGMGLGLQASSQRAQQVRDQLDRDMRRDEEATRAAEARDRMDLAERAQELNQQAVESDIEERRTRAEERRAESERELQKRTVLGNARMMILKGASDLNRRSPGPEIPRPEPGFIGPPQAGQQPPEAFEQFTPDQLADLDPATFQDLAPQPVQPTNAERMQAQSIAEAQFSRGNYDLEPIAEMTSPGLAQALRDISSSGATSVDDLRRMQGLMGGDEDLGELVKFYLPDASDEERGQVVRAMRAATRVGQDPFSVMKYIADTRAAEAKDRGRQIDDMNAEAKRLEESTLKAYDTIASFMKSEVDPTTDPQGANTKKEKIASLDALIASNTERLKALRGQIDKLQSPKSPGPSALTGEPSDSEVKQRASELGMRPELKNKGLPELAMMALEQLRAERGAGKKQGGR